MEKTCHQCQQQFKISNDDLKFHEKVSPIFNGKKYLIPPPTLCQDCRQQRRLAFRNERKLYHRKCDLCGQQIISIYHANSAYKVYCNTCWWSDKWDPMSYSQEISFDTSFFKQIKELQLKVPRLALFQKSSENSEYTNHCKNNKNCYLCIDMSHSEDVYYSKWIINCQNCLDCYNIEDAQLCYEVQYQMKGYGNIYNFFSDFSTESAFLYNCTNCTNCSNCFMCSNLDRKQYCVYNKQLSKKEYEGFISRVDLGSFQQ